MLLIVCFAIIAICLPNALILLWRNNPTYRFRMDLINKVSAITQIDIVNDKQWKWRYEAFDSVSYWKIVYSFKKFKVENFYPNTAFIDPNITKDYEE